MTKDEALKLALEFIERINKDGWILADFEPQMYEAMNAIKEALAQRTWVGLTDEEIADLWSAQIFHINDLKLAKDFVRDIEAKLKEKNT